MVQARISRWRWATLVSAFSRAAAADAAAAAASGDTGARACASHRDLLDDMAKCGHVISRVATRNARRCAVVWRADALTFSKQRGQTGSLNRAHFEQIVSWSSLCNSRLCTL